MILDGVASDKGHDNKAFCAAEEDLCRICADKEISMIPTGFITGIPGGILNECIIRPIKGLTLLAKADPKKPDPIAAATLVEAVNKIYELKINTADLKKKKDKIHSDFKELSDKYSADRKTSSGMYM